MELTMVNTITQEKLLTVPELAKRLRVHTSSIYRWKAEGKIIAVKVGKSVRFSREELDRIKKEGIK